MAVTLHIGSSISLTAAAAGVTAVTIRFVWDDRVSWADRARDGLTFDLDMCALACDGTGHVPSDDHMVFYNNSYSPDGAIHDRSDDLLLSRDAPYQENITVDLKAISTDVTRIVFAVAIYDDESKGHTFAEVSNSYLQLLDASNDEELARYNFIADGSTATAVELAELYRYDGGWNFGAIGRGCTSGLAGIARTYGVNVG